MIEASLRAFVNLEQNNWARLLPMAKFAYNNAKNATTGYMSFELNCSNHVCVLFKEDINPCFWLKIIDKLLLKLQKQMTIYQKNLHYVKKLQK